MVTVHVSEHNRINLIRAVACGGEGACDAACVEARVKEHKLFACVDHGGRKEKLRLVCGNMRCAGGLRKLFRGGVHAKDALRLGHGACASQKRGDFKATKLHTIEFGCGRAEHFGSGKGGADACGGEGQRCGP